MSGAGGSSATEQAAGANAILDDAKAFHAFVAASVELSDAHVTISNSNSLNGRLLTVVRSVRDIDQGIRRKYLYNIPLGSNNVVIPPHELHSSILARIPSPTGDKIAIFREETTTDAKTATNQQQQVLEIWSQGGAALLRRIKLPKDDLHGKLVFDATGFGKPCWNSDETALVYIAERKAPDSVDFFHQTFDALQDPKEAETLVNRGTKATLGIGKTEKWGEKYAKQSALSDLFCVHVQTGRVAKLHNCPGANDTQSTQGSYTLGQPVFSPDGNSILYVAWDAGGGTEMPRRLGLIYCQQRQSGIYASPISKLMEYIGRKSHKKSELEPDDSYICLTPDSRISCSPRFSPRDERGESKLVFLCSERGFDTHAGCLALHAMSWKDNKALVDTRCTLVQEVWNPNESSASSGSVMGMLFPGLFLLSLPEYPFLSSEYLVTTTQWGSSARIVRISLKTGELRVIGTGEKGHYSDSLLYASLEGGVIFQTSAPNRIPALWHVHASVLTESTSLVDADKTALPNMLPIASSKYSKVPERPSLDFNCDIQLLGELSQTSDDLKVEGIPMHTILLLPNITKYPNPPLIVVPHGGPHSVSSTTYVPSLAYMCGHGGYAVALVNYRGSTGFGQGLIQSLTTRIGTQDVGDVVAATLQLQQSGLVDPDRIGICGGSHGGFLTGHCTGQHPELFRVAAMRNPVVNIPSMTTATDIPDWCFVEALGSYDWQDYRPPTPDELQLMWEKSPIRYIQNVKAPTLVALGLKDLRVPPSQGLEWFYTLRARGLATKLLMYDEDDHAIAGPQAESDHWINIKRWFDAYF